VANCFVAKNRMRKVAAALKELPDEKRRHVPLDFSALQYTYTKPIEAIPNEKLDDDMSVALLKMERIQNLYDRLPHIDCGSCGAPTCRALAEDVVRGKANVEDCVFMLRKKVKGLAEAMVDLSAKMPQTLSGGDEKGD